MLKPKSTKKNETLNLVSDIRKTLEKLKNFTLHLHSASYGATFKPHNTLLKEVLKTQTKYLTKLNTLQKK